MRARSASGSTDSPSAVDPTRSQKSTVTTLRCSRAGSEPASSAPHALQKRASSALARPQLGQSGTGDSHRGEVRAELVGAGDIALRLEDLEAFRRDLRGLVAARGAREDL